MSGFCYGCVTAARFLLLGREMMDGPTQPPMPPTPPTPVAAPMGVPVSPAWQLGPCRQKVRCAQCRGVIGEGELLAWHPLSRLAFHPSCAGVASGGDVVAPKNVYVRPDERRVA